MDWGHLPWDAAHARTALAARGVGPGQIEAWLDLHIRERFAAQYLRGRDGRPWQVRPYQRESLESLARRKVHCDGRDVGKTSEIEIVAAWALVACPNSEMLVAAQTENHLFPLMERIARRMETTPEFAPSLAEIKRSPSWRLRFTNGFVLWGRIAGPRGINFQGMHVDWQLVDEAQEMTDASWGELFQALNGGGRRWVYGVPNGLRNGFHRMTQMREAEQYNWPSTLNPEFTQAKDAELARLYGGRQSPGYVHRVLGQHGPPMHAVFDIGQYQACIDPALANSEERLTGDEPFEAPSGPHRGRYYLGCDLGYARDPSEFVVYENSPPYLAAVYRLHLEGVNYARQQHIIEELDRAYGFAAIGIDAGNNGRAVAHQLMAHGGHFCARVHAIEFGGAVSLPPLPDGRVMRRRAKEFMTSLLRDRMSQGTLRFPPGSEREGQYAAHTYQVNSTGQICYEKGNDHIIDADRCAVYCHWLDTLEPEASGQPGVDLLGF